jgi:hypothetical protein
MEKEALQLKKHRVPFGQCLLHYDGTQAPLRLEGTKQRQYTFPPETEKNLEVVKYLEQEIGEKETFLTVDQRGRIHRIGSMDFSWELQKFQLQVISLKKGLVGIFVVKALSTKAVKQYFSGKVQACLMDKKNDRIVVIIEDILTLTIPSIIE